VKAWKSAALSRSVPPTRSGYKPIGAKWICRSGTRRSGRVLRKAPASTPFEVSGPPPSPKESFDVLLRCGAVKTHRLRAAEDNRCDGMVLQVTTNARQICHWSDAKTRQMVSCAYAG
jgi:hypothetical protein